VVETHLSREAKHVEELIERFRSRNDADVQSACFGIAGPVHNGICRTTNLPWLVSERGIRNRFKWPHVRLINDLVATALSVPLLRQWEVTALNRARLQRGQNIALLAAGTGLGQAFLVYHHGRHVPLASEGGHVDFAPGNEEEIKLWLYLRRRFGHVSPERVVSGPGLVNIYSWLREARRTQEPPWLKKMLREMDPGRVITETGLNNGHPLCSEAVRIFVSILGSIAGNLALTSTARGGVYLGGGIPPKILAAIRKGGFMEAFTSKGRFSDYMKGIPVRVILNERSALLGAASCAFQMIGG
jgi:glucokinase